METKMKLIREPEIRRDASGEITYLSFTFGPHYFVGVEIEDGKVNYYMGATHHGFKADASQVNGELEQFIDELKARHPDSTF
jgi:hypothetical protein